MNILKEIADYLAGLGFGEIFLDFLPDEPDECAALYIRDAAPGGDGSGGAALECLVRGGVPENAARRAGEMMAALDSGLDERLIALGGTMSAVIRPKRGPRKLKEDGFGRVVYGFECGMWKSEAPASE